MTTLTYTLAALPALPDGRYPVHMYIKVDEPTNTDVIRQERKASEDAQQILADIIKSNLKGPEEDHLLLQRGEMPATALPLFVFALGVSWDKVAKMPHYSKVDYRRTLQNRKWNLVAALGMELYDATYTIIHKREKSERKGKPVNINKEGLDEARVRFNAWADGLLLETVRKFHAIEANDKMRTCERRHGDNCSPCKFDCANYCEGGKCKELKV